MGELQENREGKLFTCMHIGAPQQLDPPPLTLDIPDHPSLPSIRGKLGSPASEALVLKVGEEKRL